ncbi:relaxase/mobilization nuclease domain-containing protein [Cryptosporangium sp. NPDC051539]|uniref:relaxase/mobilization nuclease domain-containing protein n=1 Tax=Cryptosporangium sp. NPDC051539 TaxID=3363962 RepID=UPI0037B022EF
MIARVHPAGVNVVGLLKYLYGPGRREEHVNPRLVSAWESAGPRSHLEPSPTGRGGWHVRVLADALMDPVRFSERAPDRPVWHCSVRLAPDDPTLTDAQWASIAGELMARTGLAPRGDEGGVRWVAVRHGDDHIHLVATLARQDGGAIRNFRDYLRLRDACRDLETQLGLRVTAPADRTTHRHPGAPELHKAHRQGRKDTPRDVLRRRVRAIAAASSGLDDFLLRLEESELGVRIRRSTQDTTRITGYAVALSDPQAANASPIYYGGSRLAPDLSLPRLRARWGEQGQRKTPSRVDSALREWVLRQASLTIRGALRPASYESRIELAAAAAEVLTVLVGVLPARQRRSIIKAAEALYRASAQPPSLRRPRNQHADGLRAMGRLIATMGEVSDAPELFALLRLLRDLALLAETLANLREAQHRVHQSRAARQAAKRLTELGIDAPANHRPRTPSRPTTQTLTPSADSRRRPRGPRPGPLS